MGGQLGGGAGAVQDLAQQEQPDGMRERRQRVRGLGPVVRQQVVHRVALLPLVVLASRKRHRSGEQDGAGVGGAVLQGVEGPERVVALPGLGRGTGAVQRGHALLQPRDPVRKALLTHDPNIT